MSIFKTTFQRHRVQAGLVLVPCAALVILQLLDNESGAAVAKFLASSAFLVVVIGAGAFRSSYGKVIFAGLIFSWCGDMFLLGSSQELFLAGLASFLLGHMAYIVAFAIRGISSRWSLSASLPILAVSLVVTFWLSPHVAPYMLIPVRVYTIIIGLMIIAAIGTRGAGGPLLIPTGAALFYFSDLSVATMQFMEPAFPTYIWGLPFYYTGQLLLALSVAYLPGNMITRNQKE